MHVLVCGGAGYIGSHVSLRLAEAGHAVTILDNLSTGHQRFVKWGNLIQADLANRDALDLAFRKPVDAVVHLGALSIVAASVQEPLSYYDNNVIGSLNLLSAMRKHGVDKIVFSSTAGVYGDPNGVEVDENHACNPIHPYGASKLMVERILADASKAYGLRTVALRYFNAAGAAPEQGIGELHEPETHLIPNVLNVALKVMPQLQIYGTDYPTHDGTCIRDYVHVLDLADAHILALSFLSDTTGSHVFNLGNSRGHSVLEVIQSVERITRQPIPYTVSARRPGDPSVLVTSSKKAREQLGWAPRRSSIDEIVGSAWTWHTREHT